MLNNTTKAKLKAGQTVFGCFTRTTDAGLVEFLAYQGWDFLVFDGEHGTIDPNHCENLVRAAELRGITPIVRPTTNQPYVILRYMDTGAHGAHIPWVNTGAEAEAAIQSLKYHPRGQRGLGGVRAADFGQVEPLGAYIERANRETLSIIHIETLEAANNIEDILSVPDVDVVFLGTTDLSHSMGHTGNLQHPDVQAAITRVFEAAAKTDVAVGIIVGNAEAAHAWAERGARYIVITLEALVGPAARTYLQSARG